MVQIYSSYLKVEIFLYTLKMHKDLLYLVSSHLTDRDRLKLKLYCHTVYFKFINDFKLCCINNYIISIKILSLTNYHLDWNRGLKYACKSGHHDLVDFMMCSKLGIGANNWNMGLQGACRGGACCAGGPCPHRDLVDLLIEYGANNWNLGLMGACEGNRSDIVKLMINKGATRCRYCYRNADDHLF